MIPQLALDTVRFALSARGNACAAPDGARHAAVAIVLHARPEGLHALLIERATRADDPWSGHMALPGGRVDPADAGAFEAAVRETLEEVGLDLAVHGELLGQLDPVQAVTQGSVTDLWIHPFVFALHELPPLRLSDEVVATVWAPLQALRSGELAGSLLAQAAGSERRFPTWEVEGRVVWGLTYRMLTDLFECIGARELDSTAASHVVRLPTRRS